MIAKRRPSAEAVRAFLANQRDAPLSYEPAGLSSMPPPAGYRADECRVSIGRGLRAYRTACRALASWEALKLSWTDVYAGDAAVREGAVVAILAHHLGLWSLSACRVVGIVGDPEDGVRFGFAYGTLGNHVERGEERFLVEFDDASEMVWYDIRAVSQPRAFLARLGHPIARLLQARFRVDSGKAMKAAVDRGAV